ncbi:hypothetical protein AGLY_017511 [Aphis glycines]|uniref:Uncharacterized protein n=1 Tax=Aphis glycines TaxID=307491 RepID=A0A6G0SV00_APHGL|nr:hypothetical protein AGLY_017511 [Aphis glycines]
MINQREKFKQQPDNSIVSEIKILDTVLLNSRMSCTNRVVICTARGARMEAAEAAYMLPLDITTSEFIIKIWNMLGYSEAVIFFLTVFNEVEDIDLLPTEIKLWNRKWILHSQNDHPSSVVETLNNCNSYLFPFRDKERKYSGRSNSYIPLTLTFGENSKHKSLPKSFISTVFINAAKCILEMSSAGIRAFVLWSTFATTSENICPGSFHYAQQVESFHSHILLH